MKTKKEIVDFLVSKGLTKDEANQVYFDAVSTIPGAMAEINALLDKLNDVNLKITSAIEKIEKLKETHKNV
jgi:hypothetical protein